MLRHGLVVECDAVLYLTCGARDGAFIRDEDVGAGFGVERYAEWFPPSQTEDDGAVGGVAAAGSGE